MASKQELYEDWKPLLEWEEDNRAVDVDQLAEQYMVEQTNYGPGVSAGGPRDHGYSEPLWKKPPRRDLTDDSVGP